MGPDAKGLEGGQIIFLQLELVSPLVIGEEIQLGNASLSCTGCFQHERQRCFVPLYCIWLLFSPLIQVMKITTQKNNF